MRKSEKSRITIKQTHATVYNVFRHTRKLDDAVIQTKNYCSTRREFHYQRLETAKDGEK